MIHYGVQIKQLFDGTGDQTKRGKNADKEERVQGWQKNQKRRRDILEGRESQRV